LKDPTQQDYEAWKRDPETIQRWKSGCGESIEVCLAWIYLCELFDQNKLAGLRCCAKRHDTTAPWPGVPCIMDREKCWSGDSGNSLDVIRKIDTLVKEFMDNDESFPLKDELVPRDRVELVLEDLSRKGNH